MILVSLCDEIWALDTNGQVTKHSQEVLIFKDGKNREKKSQTTLDPEDKDWELVESL